MVFITALCSGIKHLPAAAENKININTKNQFLKWNRIVPLQATNEQYHCQCL